MSPIPTLTAAFDPALRATLVASTPLRYARGPDAALDRPAHVRAGSGLAWVGARLAVVQDDANFIALVDPHRGDVTDVVLPAGQAGRRQFDEGRGNKHAKLDLEACVALPTPEGLALVVFGSGSTPVRDRVVVVHGLDGPAPRARVVHAAALYSALRDAVAFAGSELNLEGAAVVGDRVVLFQRGNGAPGRGREPVDATGELSTAALLRYLAEPASTAPPVLANVRRYALGDVDGARLTFTDATTRDDGRVYYLAAAEASPDAVRDGPVAGAALGVMDPAHGGARWARLYDAAGQPLRAKAEGLAPDPHDPRVLHAVLDVDDPDAPAVLCTIALAGPW